MTDKKQSVQIVVDNESWFLPYADELLTWMKQGSYKSKLCRNHDEIEDGDVAFYLGCVKITPPEVLKRNTRNLVAHASDLPKGRGFSPWAYAILEGKNEIPLCLLEAIDGVDEGPIVYKNHFQLDGTELVDEVRDILGKEIVALCEKFLSETPYPKGQEQHGKATYYKRRTPKDSILDPKKTIAEQFDLLRIVDNEKYPAFFEMHGQKYTLKIEKDKNENT